MMMLLILLTTTITILYLYHYYPKTKGADTPLQFTAKVDIAYF